MKYSMVVKTGRFLFLFLFIYTGFSKIINYESFVLMLMKSPINPFPPKDFALVIIGLEIFVVILLLIQPLQLVFGLICILMAFFSGYLIALRIFYGENMCGCGSLFEFLNFGSHLFVNIALTVLSAIIWMLLVNQNLVHSKIRTKT